MNSNNVSRHHASLMLREDGWVLVSLGRNGVLVENQRITEHPLDGETKFRLGSSGPYHCFADPGATALKS